MSATPRDIQRLQGVHPKLVVAVLKLLNQFPMFVVMGLRTAEQQHVLWLQRPKVTEKDGYIHKSNHQAHSDGLGHAADLAWQGATPFGETMPWPAFGTAVEALGLIWGGRWPTLVDRPHVELPDLTV